MTIFGKKLKRSAPADRLTQTLDLMRSHINGNSNSASAVSISRSALSMESLKDNESQGLELALEHLNQGMNNVTQQLGIAAHVTQQQLDAATAIGMVAGDPEGYLNHKYTPQVSTESMVVVNNSGVADVFATRHVASEAYDEKANKDAVVYSMAYNLMAARQDEFGEAFFPTVVVSPDSIGYAVTIRLIRVYNDLKRNVNGNLDSFNKRNILRAVIDSTILKNEQTRIVPVYRAGVSADKFVAVATIPAKNVVLEGETIPTSPLLIGKQLSLLALSQTDTLLANGTMDSTDAIDPAVNLQNIYVKVGADILMFKVEDLPYSNFAPAPQGMNRLMNLAFKTTSILVNAQTKNADGTALAGALAAAVSSNLIVRIGVTLSGSVNLETGDTEVFANGLKVEQVQDSSGNLMDLASGAALAMANVVGTPATGSVLGYDLFAYRTNSNKRQRGQLLDTSYHSQFYAVPLRGPISVPRPVSSDNGTDSSDLSALITTTHIRTSNAAVSKLLETAGTLAGYVDARDTAGDGPDVLGTGRFLVRPTYFSENLDMALAIDSISSHKRAADIQAVLVSKIRDFAYRMYRDSGYKAAADGMAGGLSVAPTIVIGTDPVLSRYLMVDGDLRTVGADFNIRVVSTLDSRMTNKIVLAFGVFEGQGGAGGEPNALHFGNMGWKPEMTVVMPISRGGQTSKELTVQPSFLHVVNCPVMAVINVSNISLVEAKKVSINMNSV